jgi:hypothetical protein
LFRKKYFSKNLKGNLKQVRMGGIGGGIIVGILS